jgi:hypothetical protein
MVCTSVRSQIAPHVHLISVAIKPNMPPSAEAIKPKSSLPIMVLRLPNMARIERGEIRKLCDQDAGQDCAEFIIGRASRGPLARSGDLRVKADLSRRIKLIWAVQSLWEKYFCFSEMQIRLYDSHPAPLRGALRNVNSAGRGAVDANGAPDEGAFLRTAKACGPDAPTLASSSQLRSAGDGGKRARSPGSTL